MTLARRTTDMKTNPVVYAVTDPSTAEAFLRPHLIGTRQAGRDVILIAAPGPTLERVANDCGVQSVGVAMKRNPAPLADLVALVSLTRVVRRIRPRAVHVGTPKAGLLVGIAAFINRVPKRIYTVHGLRFETASGSRRRTLRLLEKLSCAVATEVIAVSNSVRDVLKVEGIASSAKVKVLGEGSIAGVDTARFAFDAHSRTRIRKSLAVNSDAKVILFVGRLSYDKGLRELAVAWSQLRRKHADLWLLVVGGEDSAQPLDKSVRRLLESDDRVRLIGEIGDTAPFYSAGDLLVLPSYREGFGSVVLEAAAAGVPTVASDVTGCRDSVLHGKTGRLAEARNAIDLERQIDRLISNDLERSRLGEAARQRAIHSFNTQQVVQRYVDEVI